LACQILKGYNGSCQKWTFKSNSLTSDGVQGIAPGDYDFHPHGDFFGESSVRNMETFGGFYYASFGGLAVGNDFTINYSGSPNVIE